MEKQEKQQRKILTENRLATVTKRETSFEGMVAQMENGEDSIYSLITNNKNIIFRPKITITQKDLREIPELRQLRSAIVAWEQRLKVTEGKEAYMIKKALIEMRKDQYIIKTAFRRPIVPIKLTRSKPIIYFNENITVENNMVTNISGVSLLDPKVCSAILCNYSRLKQDSSENFENDTWYLIYDFENICDKALENFPLYKRIVEYKIDGKSNQEIQSLLQQEFGIKHSVEYISSLYRKKIPNLIASAAEDNYLSWYYLNEEKGTYKKCSKCGQIKLANNRNFSKNNTSKDGWYSLCKQCRQKKGGK